ncbi:MAG: 3-deoxy-D-arabino-heptulosonate 7-phosphate (DAHP) synthase class II, partial [Myxococcota bacterium]
MRNTARRGQYEALVERILDAMSFLHTTGASADPALRTVELYSSHEG